jgi:nitrate reductase gamma subunit
MVWTIIILALILLLAVIVITQVKIDVNYRHYQDDDLLEAKVFIWKMRVYTFSAPVIKIDDDSAAVIVEDEKEIAGIKTKNKLPITPELIIEDLRWLKDFLEHVVGLHKILRRFLKKVNVNKLTWHTDIGVGDAAHTAQLVGAIWTIKGSIVGLIGNTMRVKLMPKLTIDPHFQAMVSHTYLSCMISFRIGHAIIAGLMLLKHWRRRPKRVRTNPSVEEKM